MCGYIDNIMSLVSLQMTSSLINRWLWFPDHGHWMSLITGSHHQENDVMDMTHPLAQHNDCYVLFILLSSRLIHIPLTMRLCNSRIPEEHLVCYQTSQHNWVIIKMLYRCLRRCLLGWHRSRLGFVTPSIGELSLGLLGNAHHYKPCKQCD